jgi:hypothetical protein
MSAAGGGDELGCGSEQPQPQTFGLPEPGFTAQKPLSYREVRLRVELGFPVG